MTGLRVARRSWPSALLAIRIAAVLIGVLLVGALPVQAQGAASGDEIGYLDGRLESVAPSEDGGTAVVALDDGRVVEAMLPAPHPDAEEAAPPFRAGQRVEVYVSPGPDGRRTYVVSDWIRRPALGWLVALFLLVSVAVARYKGLRAFVSTAASLMIVIGFVVPRIVAGADPVWTSLLGVGGILVLAIYFVHGVSWSTTVALVGTAIAVVVTMGLGVFFANAAHLTGYGSEDAGMIAAVAPQVALRGLMLAGLLVGALGALTDITIVQAAVVRELAHADPDCDLRTLYLRGMRVGTDHVGSLVNTLVLAYTGAALPLLVLLSQGSFGLSRAVNMELIAAEVVHTLVGSIGLVLAVPLTTSIAAFAFRGDRLPLRPGELDAGHAH